MALFGDGSRWSHLAMGEGVAQWVDYFSNVHDALGSKTSTT